MKLLEYIEKHQKKRKQFSKSEDYQFYSKNRSALAKLTQFSFLSSGKESDFRIIRANIIIHGLINKAIIEQEVKNLVKYTESHEILTHEDFVEVLKQRIVTRPYLEVKYCLYICTAIMILWISAVIGVFILQTPFQVW